MGPHRIRYMNTPQLLYYSSPLILLRQVKDGSNYPSVTSRNETGRRLYYKHNIFVIWSEMLFGDFEELLPGSSWCLPPLHAPRRAKPSLRQTS